MGFEVGEGCNTCGGGALSKLAKGAVGLTKYALSLDQAKPEVITSRREKCRECPHAVGAKWLPVEKKYKCGKCDCVLVAKTSIASEKCPDDRW
jgi:hypothetical protein